jgi:hypothetical protein
MFRQIELQQRFGWGSIYRTASGRHWCQFGVNRFSATLQCDELYIAYMVKYMALVDKAHDAQQLAYGLFEDRREAVDRVFDAIGIFNAWDMSDVPAPSPPEIDRFIEELVRMSTQNKKWAEENKGLAEANARLRAQLQDMEQAFKNRVKGLEEGFQNKLEILRTSLKTCQEENAKHEQLMQERLASMDATGAELFFDLQAAKALKRAEWPDQTEMDYAIALQASEERIKQLQTQTRKLLCGMGDYALYNRPVCELIQMLRASERKLEAYKK